MKKFEGWRSDTADDGPQVKFEHPERVKDKDLCPGSLRIVPGDEVKGAGDLRARCPKCHRRNVRVYFSSMKDEFVLRRHPRVKAGREKRRKPHTTVGWPKRPKEGE